MMHHRLLADGAQRGAERRGVHRAAGGGGRRAVRGAQPAEHLRAAVSLGEDERILRVVRARPVGRTAIAGCATCIVALCLYWTKGRVL